MTTPVPSSGQPSDRPPLSAADQQTVDALQRALATEHAALWVLQLVTAFVGDDAAATVAEAATAHRTRRDATEALLRDRGVAPVAAEPAYATPAEVTDQQSALAILVTAETDVAAAWRSAIEHTDDPAVRSAAMDGLTDAAVRATRWRSATGATPATVPFPGAPA